MTKKMILVSGIPASGKTYTAHRIAENLKPVSWFDKDDLFPLVNQCFSFSKKDFDMDSSFYKTNIRPSEYETLLSMALKSLVYSDYVIINAPLGNEIRSFESMNNLKESCHYLGAQLVLIWVKAPAEIIYKRMKARNEYRDQDKLEHFESYISSVNLNSPAGLLSDGAIDLFFEIDNTDSQSFEYSLKEFLSKI